MQTPSAPSSSAVANRVTGQRQRLILFGASGGGRRALRMLDQDHDILAFVDNNATLQGTQVADIPVVSPSILVDLEFDRLVITSQWVDDIRLQVTGLGIPDWKIDVLQPATLLPAASYATAELGSSTILAPQDEDADFLDIWACCAPYTMTSFERGLALFRAIRHLLRNRVPGAIVECGVWKGGSTMIAMLTQMKYGHPERHFYLFDTFTGMTEPGPNDLDLHGRTARALLDTESAALESSKTWAIAGLDQVKRNIALTGYDMDKVTFIQGDVAHTLPRANVNRIALLRLDTDFYQSTLIELRTLYPRLTRNGVLLIDDYGHWQGARQATEEYFARPGFCGSIPFLQRIDYTGRIGIRTDDSEPPLELRYDYVPPGLENPELLERFPALTVSDPTKSHWKYLRRSSPHYWRVDARNLHDVSTGVLSVEEALLLYNNALAFQNSRGLEIGCHLAWSTAHLVAAGLSLEVIDPAFSRSDQLAWVEDSLRGLGGGDYRLWAGFSPSVIEPIVGRKTEPIRFAFIDGNHEGDSPQRDAEEVALHCAETACVMFHDLVSPFVARGLAVMRNLGWRVGIYNTMQIMGVAWRGDFAPVRHVMDPTMPEPDSDLLPDFPLLSERADTP